MEQVRRLFADYCYYRQHTAHIQRLRQAKPYLRDPKPTPVRLKQLAHMVAWCQARHISPSEWLYSLFVSRRWLYAPKLERPHLQSEKHIPKYQRLRDHALYQQRRAEVEAASAPSLSTFDPNRDLSHTAEDSKRDYLALGQVEVCMARMATETFGYHPRSSVCARCPRATECLAQLQRSVDFDVLALRRGEITSDVARGQALSRVQRYGR